MDPTRWTTVDVAAVPAGDGWLSAAEAERAAGHRFPKRRSEYRLRRWAGKQAVAAVTPGFGADGPAGLARIEVLNRPDGVPYVLVDGCDLGLTVSLADRAGRAVCLLSPVAAGIDVELVEPRSDAFVEDFLTAAEAAFVRARPAGDDRDATANLVWSAKESALKLLGTGLRADTRTVEVHACGEARADGWAPLEVDAGGRLLPGWWRRDGDFVVTTVTAQPGPPPQPC